MAEHLNHILQADPNYAALEQALSEDKSPQLVTGLSQVHKAHVIISLVENLGREAHVVMPDEASAIRLCEDLNQLLGYEGALFFPNRDLVFMETEGVSQEYEHARLGVLGRIVAGQAPIVVSAITGASAYTIPPENFQEYTDVLVTGESYSLEELLLKLVQAGYQRTDQVDGVSQFAVRGGILDIFPASEPQPYRIEFWGDEIDTIAPFDLFTQRRMDPVEEIRITPVREALISNPKALISKLQTSHSQLRGKYGKLAKEHIEQDIIKLEDQGGLASADRYFPFLYEKMATLFDYCTQRLLFICEPINSKENLTNALKQQGEDIKLLLEAGVLFSGCDHFSISWAQVEHEIVTRTTAILDTFVRSLPDMPLEGMHAIKSIQLSPWSGDYELLVEDLKDYLSQNYGIVIMAGTERAVQALYHDLDRDELPVQIGGDLTKVPKRKVVLLEGTLSGGIQYPEIGFLLISHVKNSGSQKKRKQRYKAGKKIREVGDLQVGDYVVHASHGIGIFDGIIKRTIHGVTKDFIKIRYAGTDALFVPVTQLDLVSKYVGAGEHRTVKLNRLNSIEWQKTRSRVKTAVKEMAKELTALYAKRMNTPGFAFSPDTELQEEFEARFPYEETDDQLRCVEEIKGDMERPVPMDRLLCGDVGFGKTEVALRAIFKCVTDGKQCAVLVPTTILAWQHFQTFSARLENYPIKVELLSRFRTPKEQKQVLRDLKSGIVHVVVGTHRVVQKDVEFKELGLCVIDEEQRFGVAHKERFKELRANVDVLTLSATPIPRTLNMAMSGIRDMSLIEEAPQDRHPVQTYVMEYQEGVIIQAIQKELRRNGQVFYLHNNIGTIDRCASNLQKALPDAVIVTAHGRMGEEQLSDIWQKLLEQEIDILVCTTIIETGVDVANANTLIIEDADRYGLSQLYQLRGRVGRSSRRAFAYFTFRSGKALSEIASKRLSAIREFTTFGSGFQIAMRDLEIRGAGNILGAQQHGHMEAVGYDMYLQLLEEAVQEEKGLESTSTVECTIDIQLDAYIPESYISNTSQRIDTYKRISSVESTEDAMDVTDELIDRFGEPPKAVLGLLDVAIVRGTASRLGISEITQTQSKIMLYPEHLDWDVAGRAASAMQGRMLVNAGAHPYYSITLQKGQGPIQAIQETLEVMGRTQNDTEAEKELPST